MFQLGMKNAFLHGDPLEDVYIEQPPTYNAQWEMICKLYKDIYGLKYNPHAYMDSNTTHMHGSTSSSKW